MHQSTEVEYCKNLFKTLSRSKVVAIIEDSNLTDKEREIINARYITGLQIKEICNLYGMEEETYKKLQHKLLVKLYNFLTV